MIEYINDAGLYHISSNSIKSLFSDQCETCCGGLFIDLPAKFPDKKTQQLSQRKTCPFRAFLGLVFKWSLLEVELLLLQPANVSYWLCVQVSRGRPVSWMWTPVCCPGTRARHRPSVWTFQMGSSTPVAHLALQTYRFGVWCFFSHWS